ncbi:MAG: HPr family phosphocarrier protein [Candidatus Izemoplasmataceae bacterium]
MEKSYKIIHQEGLTAKPANILAKLTSKLDNEIFIHYDNVTLTTKSTVSILSLGVPKGGEISIIVKGNNAEEIHRTIYNALKDINVIE